MSLFGVMLAFHGMAVFAQEGRFRQLGLKTSVALLPGWNAVGLIAPFVLLALGKELVAVRARFWPTAPSPSSGARCWWAGPSPTSTPRAAAGRR